MKVPGGRRFVFLTQVYPPDPAALGQHLADAAEELVRRGHRVVVFTANRGFDNPSRRFSSRETLNGVDVRRLPLGSFGKSSIALRLASGAVLMAQEIVAAARLKGVHTLVVSTSPPLGPVAAAALSHMMGVQLKYWPMDVNPDQMVALDKISAESSLVKMFDWMNRFVLRRASSVIALDPMMARILEGKANVAGRLSVVRPWAADEPAEPVEGVDNPFRSEYGFGDRVVVMYSGNHALSHPLTTVLDAARRLRDDPHLLLAFVGGGVGKAEVDANVAANVVSIPYQERGVLTHSLSAADVHLVSIGNAMPGIVHPSKIYGAMAMGRPIFLLGPESNPMAEILAQADIGWRVAHGDVDGAERVLREISASSHEELRAKGARARELLMSIGTRSVSIARVCDILESGSEPRRDEDSGAIVSSRRA